MLLGREREMSHLMKGVEFAIFVDRYDAVTPFGQDRKEGPPPLSHNP